MSNRVKKTIICRIIFGYIFWINISFIVTFADYVYLYDVCDSENKLLTYIQCHSLNLMTYLITGEHEAEIIYFQ